jgi:flavin-binding protein dodecin
MTEHVYKVVELVGTSKTGVTDAIQTAITRAGSTLRNLRWFEIVRTTGQIENGRVRYFQVTLKVGFTMEDVR